MSNLSIAEQVRDAVEAENLIQFIGLHLTNGLLSIRAVAALCGVSDTAIIRGGDFKSAKLAEKLEAHGFKGADLAENGFPPAAVWLTIEYFAYDSKAEAPVAKAIARTFGAVGVKTAFAQIEAPTPEIQIPAYPPSPVLPPVEQRLATLMTGLEKAAHFGFDPSNPRYAQGIKDQIANILLGASTPIPTASTELAKTTPADEPPAERWGGVVEIAISMGGNRYAIDKVRTTLGRYVSDRAATLGLNRRQEERIVQGVACAVWLYQDCAALRSCIMEFFDSRNAKYLAPSDLAKLWKEQGGPKSANTCSLNRRLMHLGYQSREGGFTGTWVALEKATKYTKVVKGELHWLPSILKKLG